MPPNQTAPNLLKIFVLLSQAKPLLTCYITEFYGCVYVVLISSITLNSYRALSVSLYLYSLCSAMLCQPAVHYTSLQRKDL